MKSRSLIIVALLLLVTSLFLTGIAESHVHYPETRVGARSQNFTPDFEKSPSQNIDCISLEQFLTAGFTSCTLVIQKEIDAATNLAYFGARYYDPTSGRFTTPDPYMGRLEDPKSFARYIYAANNPLRYYDLFGFDYIDVTGSGEVYWVIEKDLVGPINPDTRRVLIGTEKDGRVQIVEGFGGKELPLNPLKQAISKFWKREYTGLIIPYDISDLSISEQNELINYYIDDRVTPIGESRLVVPPQSSYLKRSANQVIYGNYSEDVTLLGTGTQIVAGIANMDIPMDFRDLGSDIENFEFTRKHLLQTGFDAIGLLPIIGTIKNSDEIAAILKNSRKGKKKYITYTADDLDYPGKIYTGRTSGPAEKTIEQILNKRKSGHHRNLGPLQPDQITDKYKAIRGREHLVREKLREKGLSTEQINPIGPRNKRKDIYLEAAIEEFE